MQTIKLALLSLCILAFTYTANAQNPDRKDASLNIITATLESIGKCPPSHNIKFGNLDRKYVTTALFVRLEHSEKLTPIPINDKVFDYEKFNRQVYPAKLNQKVEISVKLFASKDENVFLAYDVK